MSFERTNISEMSGYVSGEQPDDTLTIKLNTNENPYPPSPRVDQVISEFQASAFRRYPPPTANQFRDIAAELHQVDRDNILATRGGDELLRLVITTFVEPGEKIGMTDPTYSLYPVLAQVQDCPTVTQPMTTDWLPAPNFAAFMNDAGAKLTFLVNPHAPSGSLLNIGTIDQIASDLEGLLLLDEAYVDFIDQNPAGAHYNAVPLIKRHKNLIILRTLSKGYSLAGLRFGYGIADASLISPMLSKTRDSYNLNTLTQKIAAAALSDQTYAAETWEQVRNNRRYLKQALANMGLTAPVSQANFLLVSVPGTLPYKAADLYKNLKERHILVRYFDHAGLDDKLRISVGTEQENQRLLDALRDLLG